MKRMLLKGFLTAAGMLSSMRVYAADPPLPAQPPPSLQEPSLPRPDAPPPVEERLPPPVDTSRVPAAAGVTLPPISLEPPLADPLPPVPATGPAPGCPTLSYPRLRVWEEQALTTLPKINIREETIGFINNLAVEYRDEQQIVPSWELRPREVIQNVPSMTLQPCKTIDPVTGCCHTEYKPCPVVQQVKVTIQELVPVKQIVIVRVPCFKPGPVLAVQKLSACPTPAPAVATRLHLHTTPNEVAVPPPPCPPPPCLPAGGPPPLP